MVGLITVMDAQYFRVYLLAAKIKGARKFKGLQ